MDFFSVLLLLAGFVLTLMAESTVPVSATAITSRNGCVDELTEMSPCLSYISSPPNNVSSLASSQCCGFFNSAFETGSASCFCYLIHQPNILGFPIDSARIFSLDSVCPPEITTNFTARISLESLCAELPPLPSLENTSGSSESGNSMTPMMIGPQPTAAATANSPAPLHSPTGFLSLNISPSALKPTTNDHCQLLPGIFMTVFALPVSALLM